MDTDDEASHWPKTVHVSEHMRTLASGRQVSVKEHWRRPPKRKHVLLMLAA
jgi:hypothetical protein